jgi:hypothetical protein
MKTGPWNSRISERLTAYLDTHLVISAEGVVTKNFPKYLENVGLTKTF